MNTETNILEVKKNTGAQIAPTPAAPSRARRLLVIGSLAAVLALGLAAGIFPRVIARDKLAEASPESVLPSVTVTNLHRTDRLLNLNLPGDVHAYQETEIFARADGYLLKWNVDIGAKVKAGQVLAEIDTPEIDQQLNQARAARAQADANLTLARSTATRWHSLRQSQAVSQQEVDEKAGALLAREADLQAADAEVGRLEKLTSFKEVRAPFAGTITRRLIDTGALIHGGANATPLFKLAQMDTLRVHVNVPQAYMRDIAVGEQVSVRVAQFPDRTFAGKVVRTSRAFDPGSRTLLAEIELPNKEGLLSPGIYVDVDISVSQADPPISAPANSVLTGSAGPQVVLVDNQGVTHLQKVGLGRDLGRTIEIVSGVSDGARVVANPSDTLADGMRVRVVTDGAVSTHRPQLTRN
jgi:RND family efflux transporter MFP subunit